MKTYVKWLRGQGGAITSPGIDHMSRVVAGYGKDIVSTVYDWTQWQTALADLNAHAHEAALRILVGYSMGAQGVDWIAGGVDKVKGFQWQIDLFVALDPTVWSVLSPIHANVKDALIFKNDNPLNIVGLGTVPLGQDFLAAVKAGKSKLNVVHTLLPHLEEDFDPFIQRLILTEIKSVLNRG